MEEYSTRYFWVLPLIGFSMGWGSFLMIQRGETLAKWVATLALVGLPWILAEPFIMSRLVGGNNPRLSTLISNFISQSIQQEIFFFTLPFLVAATHIEDKGQLAFTLVFILAALISTVDPIYDRYVYKNRIVSLAFHSLCCFVAALVILPIVVKLPTDETLLFALLFVVIWLVLVLPHMLFKITGFKRKAGALLGMMAIPVCIWAFRSSIPAAGILVSHAAITTDIINNEPANELTSLSMAELADGVYAYAAIRAPMNLSQKILFRWQHEGWVEDIPAEITGGRAEGFRTYSHKQVFVTPVDGRWDVDILTSQGQLLQHLSFNVLP